MEEISTSFRLPLLLALIFVAPFEGQELSGSAFFFFFLFSSLLFPFPPWRRIFNYLYVIVFEEYVLLIIVATER